MAGVHREMGKMEEARLQFLRCAEIYATVYGPQHSETLDAQEQAARCSN
eukprot:CAMPEP_0114148388 /NCGR_PEP_ID=MMETSP0043_2-20121206/21605_1 /TAXON_ID=464988 /ORGANISM="Hemiselmis andersenii, Strain CCMP644" /LENGTH=48 /DNA_ID= /DNA_START= /DNA_END= /DNA_ORIENTATION=